MSATNFNLFSCLGVDLLKEPSITYFTSGNTRIHIFIDACHAIILIRISMRLFVDSLCRRVDLTYLEKILNLQEIQGLHLANKISKSHIFFQKQKMKVRLG